MAKRSLKASPLGIAKAKQAFQRREWTQEYLASTVELQTRQPIWKFFSGRPIERHLFIDICFQLDLDWEEIAELPKIYDLELDSVVPESSNRIVDADDFEWISQVRSHVVSTIQRQCKYTQNILNLTSTLTLSQIYTDVYLLPHLSSQRWLEVEDLQSIETFNRDHANDSRQIETTSRFQPHKIAVLDAIAMHPQLMILGKPGAGKTTALQHLALQCSEGTLCGDRIPVFIALRDWVTQSEPFNLEQYLSHAWAACGISAEQIQTALHAGKVWLFLDGLDEIPPDLRVVLQRQIQKWVETYPHLPLVMTCRLAMQDVHFQGFTYMEVADFDPTQIETFVQQWFGTVNAESPERGAEQAQQFLEQLQTRENQPIRELAVTPILLHLTCLVFQERGAFPKKRSRLYQHGLDVLLVQWDAIRGIHRGSAHDQLSLPDRLNILSQLAATMFEQGRYFFEKTEVLTIIVEYLAASPNRSSDPETLWLESEAILQAIVMHHGLLVERAQDVYSFSHLTFQEYLTARKFFTQSLAKSAHSSTPYSLEMLASHVVDPRWQDVIALTFELLPNPQPLLRLMEQYTSALIRDEPVLQNILQWTYRKAEQIHSPHQPVAVQAFYLSLILDQTLDLALAIDPSLTFDLSPELALDLDLFRLLTQAQRLMLTPHLQQGLTLCFAFDLEPRLAIAKTLKQNLALLSESLTHALANLTVLQDWCLTEGDRWIEQLRQILIQHRDIGYQWHLTATQQQRLNQYYRTTLFLTTCLYKRVQTGAITSNPTSPTLEKTKCFIAPSF